MIEKPPLIAASASEDPLRPTSVTWSGTGPDQPDQITLTGWTEPRYRGRPGSWRSSDAVQTDFAPPRVPLHLDSAPGFEWCSTLHSSSVLMGHLSRCFCRRPGVDVYYHCCVVDGAMSFLFSVVMFPLLPCLSPGAALCYLQNSCQWRSTFLLKQH